MKKNLKRIRVCVCVCVLLNHFTVHLKLKQHCKSITKAKVKVTQSCPTLWDTMDYTVHGILQARILEWVTVPYSRGSSQPRDRIQVSRIAGRFFTSCAAMEAQEYWSG